MRYAASLKGAKRQAEKREKAEAAGTAFISLAAVGTVTAGAGGGDGGGDGGGGGGGNPPIETAGAGEAEWVQRVRARIAQGISSHQDVLEVGALARAEIQVRWRAAGVDEVSLSVPDFSKLIDRRIEIALETCREVLRVRNCGRFAPLAAAANGLVMPRGIHITHCAKEDRLRRMVTVWRNGFLLPRPVPGCIGMVKVGRRTDSDGSTRGKSHTHTFLVHDVQGDEVIGVDGNYRNAVAWSRRPIRDCDFGPIV